MWHCLLWKIWVAAGVSQRPALAIIDKLGSLIDMNFHKSHFSQWLALEDDHTTRQAHEEAEYLATSYLLCTCNNYYIQAVWHVYKLEEAEYLATVINFTFVHMQTPPFSLSRARLLAACDWPLGIFSLYSLESPFFSSLNGSKLSKFNFQSSCTCRCNLYMHVYSRLNRANSAGK